MILEDTLFSLHLRAKHTVKDAKRDGLNAGILDSTDKGPMWYAAASSLMYECVYTRLHPARNSKKYPQ